MWDEQTSVMPALAAESPFLLLAPRSETADLIRQAGEYVERALDQFDNWFDEETRGLSQTALLVGLLMGQFETVLDACGKLKGLTNEPGAEVLETEERLLNFMRVALGYWRELRKECPVSGPFPENLSPAFNLEPSGDGSKEQFFLALRQLTHAPPDAARSTGLMLLAGQESDPEFPKNED